MEGPEILTQRLRLSQLIASDAPTMYEYRSDPEVCQYQSFEPGTLEDVEVFISGLESNTLDTAGTWFQFAIRLRESDQLIGDFGTHFIADDPRQVEIGFTVSPAYQGQGYGTEAVIGVLDYLLGPLQKHRVFASVDPRNAASIALLKRAGLRQEAHFIKSLWFKGGWTDDMVFGVLESEWKRRYITVQSIPSSKRFVTGLEEKITMKRANFFKPIVILCTSITRLVFVAFALYVIFNYPRKAETFEINSLNPTQRILIATQSSDFKDELTKILCDSLKDTSTTIKGIDVGGLPEINDEDWDRILIMNSFIIQLNKDVDQFITRALAPQKILAFVTSGGADWLPKPDIEIDAFTSASKKMVINDLVELITDWMGKEDDEDWEPDDYLLALNYFPQVNVKVACEAISSEKERYLAKYPDLENLINRAGYQLLRFKEVQSALVVFMMNIRLFPDSWNVYDSYGEALLIDGERESALSSYRKAVKLNPESKSTNDMLKKLSRK